MMSHLYCPRCAFPVYQRDRFCGRCDLPVPPAPAGSRPLAPPVPRPGDPHKKCWNCPAAVPADRSFCTWCGADLTRAPVVGPKPTKPPRQFRNPPLAVSLFVLAVQIPLLVLLLWAYSRDRSVANLIFVAGIAATAVGNLVAAIGLAASSARRRTRR